MITLTEVEETDGPQGITRTAFCRELRGLLFVWTPRRIKTYTCPEAGVEHKLYWRSHGAGRRGRHFACEHNSVVR